MGNTSARSVGCNGGSLVLRASGQAAWVGGTASSAYPQRTTGVRPLSLKNPSGSSGCLKSSCALLRGSQFAGLEPLIEFLRVEPPLPPDFVRQQFAFLGKLINGRSTHLQVLRRFNGCQPFGFHQSLFPTRPLVRRVTSSNINTRMGGLSSPDFELFRSRPPPPAEIPRHPPTHRRRFRFSQSDRMGLTTGICLNSVTTILTTNWRKRIDASTHRYQEGVDCWIGSHCYRPGL